MDKLDQKVVSLGQGISNFCKAHTTISVIIGIILLGLVIGGCGHHRGFRGEARGFGGEFGGERGMMMQGRFGGEMGGMMKGGKGACPMGLSGSDLPAGRQGLSGGAACPFKNFK